MAAPVDSAEHWSHWGMGEQQRNPYEHDRVFGWQAGTEIWATPESLLCPALTALTGLTPENQRTGTRW